jgi:hypothetical protein
VTVGAIVLLVAAVLLKWWYDTTTFESIKVIANLRAADHYGAGLNFPSDIKKELAETDARIAQLGSLWFVPAAEKGDVKGKLEDYRAMVEKNLRQVEK